MILILQIINGDNKIILVEMHPRTKLNSLFTQFNLFL